MGPSLILDKSSLQTLSASEASALGRFYSVIVAPVLVIEIMADLKKHNTGDRTPEQEVIQLANKLSQVDSAVSVHYLPLMIQSLLGNSDEMNRRPVVGSSKFVRAHDGRIGVVFDETPEELAILRWQDGLFSDAEQAIAEQWRISTKSIDLEKFKNEHKATEEFQSAKNLDELFAQVKDFLLRNDSNPELLKMILLEFGFNQKFARHVFLRWEEMRQKSIQSFAPYALHCFKANLMFFLGLIRNFITTRPTNRVDLEYVYYLPFCSVFSSKDKFHKELVPLFLEGDQLFVTGEELKADIANLKNNSSPTKMSGPPANAKSPTYQAWKTSAPDWEAGTKVQSTTRTPEESKNAIDNIMSLTDSPEITDPEILKRLDLSKIDFISRKRSVRLNDPCPCQSGMKFRDCHWTLGRK